MGVRTDEFGGERAVANVLIVSGFAQELYDCYLVEKKRNGMTTCYDTVSFSEFGQDVPGPASLKKQLFQESPRMYMIGNFLSEEECEHILELCKNRWIKTVVSKGPGAYLLGHEDVSEVDEIGHQTAFNSVRFDFMESFVISAICARVSVLAGQPYECVEPPVAIRQNPGQDFKLHHDGDYRSHTVFTYLNGPLAQGETEFPHIDAAIPASTGTAIMWPNLCESGDANLTVSHRQSPPIRGVKYGLYCFVNKANQREDCQATNVRIHQR